MFGKTRPGVAKMFKPKPGELGWKNPKAIRHVAQRTEIPVILFRDVGNLGKKGEVVLVDGIEAANYIVPFKLGYYVPSIADSRILPIGWKSEKKVKYVPVTIYPHDY